MSIRPRALWLGLAAASLAAVLVATGLLVWQRQELRRYATVAELNDALNAAGRQATAMRNMQTTERIQDSRYSGRTDRPRIDPLPPDQVLGR